MSDYDSSTGLPRLQGTLVPDSEIQARIDLFQSTDSTVRERLVEGGIPVDSLLNTKAEREFPTVNLEVLGRSSTAEYERINNELLYWHGIIVTKVAVTKNALLGAENALTAAKAFVRKNGYHRYKTKEIRTQEELDTTVITHPAVVEAEYRAQIERQTLNLLEAFRSKIEAGLRAVSRYVAVREQDVLLQTQNRGGNSSPFGLPR